MSVRSFRSVGAAIGLVLVLGSAREAAAQNWSPTRPDSHAPIGVMGDHTHETGELMLSFRFVRMAMDGNRTGTSRVSTADVLDAYPIAPLRMPMNMFMMGVMYATTERVTLFGTIPVMGLSMDHITRTDTTFTTTSAGLGDVSMGALVLLAERPNQRVHLNVGIGLPTGSVVQRDDTPAMANAILPYPMQTGGGGLSFRPGLTWLGQNGRAGWGAQAASILRVGTNERNYRQSQQLDVTGWVSVVLKNWASLSVRLASSTRGNIKGADAGLDPAMVPTADPQRQGGHRLDVGLGLNLYKRGGKFESHRLALEILGPIRQRLDGPQLETDWRVVVGWQKSFVPR